MQFTNISDNKWLCGRIIAMTQLKFFGRCQAIIVGYARFHFLFNYELYTQRGKIVGSPEDIA